MRISVTDLESWRFWKAKEDSTLDDLLNRLARVEPPNAKMLAGKAMASLFENAKDGDIDLQVVEGWHFDFSQLDADFPVCAMREMKFEYPILTPSGPVTLVGKVDGWDGVTVRDQKLSDKFEVEDKYTDSLQWRAYLSMLKAKRFVYDVFVGRIDEKKQVVTVTEYNPVTFYTYPDVEKDVLVAVNELAEVVVRYQDRIVELKKGATAA